MISPTQDTVTHWGLTWPQILTLIVALLSVVFGVIFGLPNLFRYLAELSKNKRQDRVRDVLLKIGTGSTGDFMFHCPKLTQAESEKALIELERAGEIVRHQDATGRTMWHFKIHPSSIESRQRNRG